MAAAKQRPGVPLDPRKKARAAELNGMGLSYSEAAGACGISEKSVERLLKEPEYRKIADDVRKRTTSVTAQAAAVVQELLAAVDDKGEPALMLRQKGAELVMKNPALLESVDADPDDDTLPGVVLRFPWAGAVDSRDSDGDGNAEAPSAPRQETGNGSTLESGQDSRTRPTPVDELDDYSELLEAETEPAKQLPPDDPGPPGAMGEPDFCPMCAGMDYPGVSHALACQERPETVPLPPSGDTPLFTEADLYPEP